MTIMMRKLRTDAVVTVAVLIAAAGAGWSLGPEDACEAAKNQESGKYAFCRARAEAKAIKRGGAVDYSKCDAKFLDRWTKAEMVAIAKDGACIDAVGYPAMQTFVAAQTDAVAAALAGGVLPPDVGSCNSDLATCVGNLAACGDDVTTCNTDLATCDDSLATCSTDLGAAQSDLTACNANFATCSANLVTCSSDLGPAQAQLSACNATFATCTGNLATCSGDLSTAQLSLTACNGSLATCNASLTTCSGDLGAAQSGLTACNGALGTCESDLALTQSGLAACTADVGTCGFNLTNCQSDLGAAQLAAATCGDSLGTCQSDLIQSQAGLAVCDADLSTCTDDLGTCWADLSACELALAGVPGQRGRTGQTQCWDSAIVPVPCAGTGQDGDTLAGLPVSFTDNGDGTVTDNRTGLMWEKLSADHSIHMYNSGYYWHSTGTKIAALNAGGGFAGYTDWRLPNVNELLSLSDYGSPDQPGIQAPFDYECNPFCTVLTCSCTDTGPYWSATTNQKDPQDAWVVNFSQGGNASVSDKTNLQRIRAVRNAP